MLFTLIPASVDRILSEESMTESFRRLYSEAVQADPGRKPGGYVRLEFVDDGSEKSWKDIVLERLPGVIESFQDKGYRASDIGIIVREGREGASVLKTLIDYANNCSTGERQKYNYNVVSNDSLLLVNSPVINFIISAISVLNDPSDMISRAAMLRFFLLSKGDLNADKAPLTSDSLMEDSGRFFPEGYNSLLENARELPLFEAIESIIGFFGVGDYSWNVAYLNTFQDYVINFTGTRNSDIQSFLEWWGTTGNKKSVVLPGNQDAMRILTIHKSKGLEFKVVILPFLSWNLDHIASKQPFLWVKPSSAPFNELGIVPVRYSKELTGTIFGEYYLEERYSVYLDNINLLYVALTRAKEAIFGFSLSNPRTENSIEGVLKSVITSVGDTDPSPGFSLHSHYKNENQLFEFGNIPGNKLEDTDSMNISSSAYKVSQVIESLRLKLHGENYFASGNTELRKKINYGKLMHEIFEGINTPSDIPFAVRKLVLEGKLPGEESHVIEKRVHSLLSNPVVAGWFTPENEVMREAGILLTNGSIRRPDRVIFKDGKAIIIDFKFGGENDRYIEQVDLYRRLLIDMGYIQTEAFIWYVDKNKIVSA